jgi:hypothetical protein
MPKINRVLALIWLADCYFSAPGKGSFQWNPFQIFVEKGVEMEKMKGLILPSREIN